MRQRVRGAAEGDALRGQEAVGDGVAALAERMRRLSVPSRIGGDDSMSATPRPREAAA